MAAPGRDSAAVRPVRIGALVAFVASIAAALPIAADVIVEHRIRQFLLYGLAEGAAIEYTSGLRHRIDVRLDIPGDGGSRVHTHSAQITRLDKGIVWNVRFDDATYTEDRLEDVQRSRTSFAKAMGRGDANPEWSVVEDSTGEQQTIAGFPARRSVMRTRQRGYDPLQQKPFDEGHLFDVWNTPSVPGLAELTAFQERYAAVVKTLPGPGGEVAGTIGLGPGAKLVAGTGGYPLRVVIKIYDPTWQPPPPATTAPKDTNTWGYDPFAEELAADRAFDPATGAMTMTENEVTNIREEPIPAEMFDLPAGLRRTRSGWQDFDELQKKWEATRSQAQPAKRRAKR